MWSLYETKKGKEVFLKPLVFSNGKSQEDVVQEILKESKKHKVIFVRGVCGSGKSSIALNLAKEIGKASIVVPVKALQKQYEEDYTNKKYLIKDDRKLKIEVITGRANHQCPYLAESGEKREKDAKLGDFCTSNEEEDLENNDILDSSCNNSQLPCRILIKDKNSKKIKEYLRKNPKIKLADFASITRVRRLSIAPACPYWSPVVPSELDLGVLDDARKRGYRGLQEREYTIYRRKKGCGYYDQFDSYIDSDVLIFNSQKYKLETLMNRKPATDIEIIDECDEFLDSFSDEKKINFNRLNFALGSLFPEDEQTGKIIDELIDLTKKILKSERVQEYSLGNEILPLKETGISELLKYFLESDFMNFVECEEENYCYHCDEVARTFENFLDETYVSFCREERDLAAKLVTTNLEKRFKEMVDKNKFFVLMSGTLHSSEVLQKVFGLQEFKIIEAETQVPGKITKVRTGYEINCRYDNFLNGKVTRKQYLQALRKCIEKAEKPALVHVNAFKDLPREREIEEYKLGEIISQEKLKEMQYKDKTGKAVAKFKNREISVLYSTKCNRGVDFPGDICESIILTRYPYPDISSVFWKVLKQTKPEHYHSFYRDKSKREFLQRIYRGLRSKEDHIFLLSPDSRVFDMIQEK